MANASCTRAREPDRPPRAHCVCARHLMQPTAVALKERGQADSDMTTEFSRQEPDSDSTRRWWNPPRRSRGRSTGSRRSSATSARRSKPCLLDAGELGRRRGLGRTHAPRGPGQRRLLLHCAVPGWRDHERTIVHSPAMGATSGYGMWSMWCAMTRQCQLAGRFHVRHHRAQANEEKLAELQRTLLELSYKDGLTGVANRRMFDSVIEKEWIEARRSGCRCR